jgi:IS5 family transposase
LAKGVAKMAKGANKLKAMGLATRTRLADKTRTVRSRARSINANLRRRTDDKIAAVKRINGELAGIAERVARQADAVVRNARRKLRALGDQASERARAAVAELERTAALTRRVAAQTRQRLAGELPPGATRVVSLHDADARPIAKGRLGKPVEFGYKAQLVDNEDGVIVDHNIEAGNPPDAPMLEPAIQRIKRRTGRAPRAVTADRGYGEQGVEDDLRAAGVRHIVLPHQRPTHSGATDSREPTRLPQDGAMAHRLRRTDQLRQTRLRTRQDKNRRARRRTNLVRPRHLRPQPRQDQRTDQLNDAPGDRQPGASQSDAQPTRPRQPNRSSTATSDRVLQVEVTTPCTSSPAPGSV